LYGREVAIKVIKNAQAGNTKIFRAFKKVTHTHT
jgi:hypothetical protein